ncbi:MAG TPA: ribbon-helix-helix domain-containing protein [Thermoanaerobaculia bacterium]|nr:ribbon-helix-helix domain-containing protein [Thermoanaerobaculia bacterium]
MKTAVSIPDDIFEQAERLARKSRKSRSEIFSAALREYVARHAPDEVTEELNRVCSTLGLDEPERFLARAAQRRLESVEW